METRWFHNPDGTWNLEIVSKSYSAITALQKTHEAVGRRTWLNNWNVCDGSFILTVELPRGA